MNKLIVFLLLILVSSAAFAQAIGRVDKKTKEFTVSPDLKFEYRVFGYQYPNATTKKMICFSSNSNDVRDNYNRCPLGSYYDTNRMKAEDRIFFRGYAGTFARMSYVPSTGKSTVFYIPKNSFVIK